MTKVTMPLIAFVLVLGVLAMALVVAMAGEGRLDRSAPQPYFPASFGQAPATCDPGHGQAPVSSGESVVDPFRADVYSTFWRQAQEPSLYLASLRPGAEDQRTYRFTYLPSFDQPVVVRLERHGGGGMRLVAKQMSGLGGYSPGRVARTIERDLTPTEVSEVERLVAQSRVFGAAQIDCSTGLDGSRWIIEANDHGVYRYLNRWSPEDGPVHDVGLAFLGLTHWRFERLTANQTPVGA